MNKKSKAHKVFAIFITFIFIFTSLHEINSHTYTTGVDNYHYEFTCFGIYKSHLQYNCNLDCFDI